MSERMTLSDFEPGRILRTDSAEVLFRGPKHRVVAVSARARSLSRGRLVDGLTVRFAFPMREARETIAGLDAVHDTGRPVALRLPMWSFVDYDGLRPDEVAVYMAPIFEDANSDRVAAVDVRVRRACLRGCTPSENRCIHTQLVQQLKRSDVSMSSALPELVEGAIAYFGATAAGLSPEDGAQLLEIRRAAAATFEIAGRPLVEEVRRLRRAARVGGPSRLSSQPPQLT